MDNPAGRFDLSYYHDRFEEVANARYADRMRNATRELPALRERFKAIQTGQRRVTADDVMSLFDPALPFVHDWTKPDSQRLAERMDKYHVPLFLSRLRECDRSNVEEPITEIWKGLGDVSLLGLVLHHAYPARFAMCSHHLASLLYIVNVPTLPKFYLEYCDELRLWSESCTSRPLTVADTQFALWIWYRLAHHGTKEQCRNHRESFFGDPWIRERRAQRIARSLKEQGRLDIARSYLIVDPTLAAMIAWVEFERMARKLLVDDVARHGNMADVIKRLPMHTLPREREVLKDLWYRTGPGRNEVIHGHSQVTRAEAEVVVDGVFEFYRHNLGD